MRLAVLALAATFVTGFAALDCGGQVEQAAACPAQLSGPCNEGAACSSSTSDGCGGVTAITCSCAKGAWSCPQLGPTRCPPTPTQCNDASEGQVCGQAGLRCESLLRPKCVGAPPVYCTCDGHSFHCDTPRCPIGTCPAPSDVTDGAACEVTGPDPSCAGTETFPGCDGQPQTVDVSCKCMNGSFVCPPIFPPACVVDGGAGPG